MAAEPLDNILIVIDDSDTHVSLPTPSVSSAGDLLKRSIWNVVFSIQYDRFSVKARPVGRCKIRSA
jgi:hypothetical protein